MRRSSSILAVFFLALPLFAQQTPAVPTEPWPIVPAATPEVYWQKLMLGNAKYVAGALTYTGLAARRTETSGVPPHEGQDPPVTILSCSDSRVPPELIFGRTVGDLFVVRVAGNVASQFDIASIEYAIDHHWTSLIVVMGHERCGAVEAALAPTDPGTPSLVALVQRIRESFIGWQTWPPAATDPGRVERAVKANARSAAAYLLAHSTVIRDAVLDLRPDHYHVGLVVAYYKLGSGGVEVVQP